MFIIIYGIRQKAKTIGQVIYSCAVCKGDTYHNAAVWKRWFTLYWIPIIPLGRTYIIECNCCGRRLKAVDALREQLRGMEQESVNCTDQVAARIGM